MSKLFRRFPRAYRLERHLHYCKPRLPNLDEAIRAVVERVAEEVARNVVLQELDEFRYEVAERNHEHQLDHGHGHGPTASTTSTCGNCDGRE